MERHELHQAANAHGGKDVEYISMPLLTMETAYPTATSLEIHHHHSRLPEPTATSIIVTRLVHGELTEVNKNPQTTILRSRQSTFAL